MKIALLTLRYFIVDSAQLCGVPFLRRYTEKDLGSATIQVSQLNSITEAGPAAQITV
ncbi:hypothetical protein ACJJIX_02030 [Microbulbifer sp. VAAC004]|uniref:hypothetical protein n=1 Tax=unclassified Microbulbifer TaxID=2619833 RepID=UPI0040390E0E